jgi:hypothetical protein
MTSALARPSGVAQIFNRPRSGTAGASKFGDPAPIVTPAGYKPAIQQITNLRYTWRHKFAANQLR